MEHLSINVDDTDTGQSLYGEWRTGDRSKRWERPFDRRRFESLCISCNNLSPRRCVRWGKLHGDAWLCVSNWPWTVRCQRVIYMQHLHTRVRARPSCEYISKRATSVCVYSGAMQELWTILSRYTQFNRQFTSVTRNRLLPLYIRLGRVTQHPIWRQPIFITVHRGDIERVADARNFFSS